MDPSEEQREEYQQQLDDITEKDLLLEIMAELKAIRYELQNDGFESINQPGGEETDRYQCLQCREIVKEDDRQKHLMEQHNAPEVLSPDGEFAQL